MLVRKKICSISQWSIEFHFEDTFSNNLPYSNKKRVILCVIQVFVVSIPFKKQFETVKWEVLCFHHTRDTVPNGIESHRILEAFTLCLPSLSEHTVVH